MQPFTTGNRFTLTGKHASVDMQTLSEAPYRTTLEKQMSFRIVKNDPVQYHPCLYTTLTAPSEMNVIGTVFYPSARKAAGVVYTLERSGKVPVIACTAGRGYYALCGCGRRRDPFIKEDSAQK